jgi:phage gp37-like protein
MTYEDFEDAILAALEPLKGTTVGVKTLETYGGEFSADSFGQFPINYPAVFICVSSMTSESVNTEDRRELTLDVYAAATDLRGEKSARRGALGSVGAYAIAKAVRVALNRLIVPGAGRVQLRREYLMGYSKTAGLCVIQAEYSFKYNQTIALERS